MKLESKKYKIIMTILFLDVYMNIIKYTFEYKKIFEEGMLGFEFLSWWRPTL